MRIKLALAVTFLLAIAGFWFFYQTAAVASRGGDDTPLYSIERHDPYGTAAIKDLLTERGVPTSILTRPAPEDSSGAVLIQVLPRERESFNATPGLQLQRLKAWLLQGNTIIQFTRSQTHLMTDYNLDATPLDAAILKDIESAEAHGKPQSDIPADDKTARWIATPTGSAPARGSLHLYSPLSLATSGSPAKDWTLLAIIKSAEPGKDEWVAAMRQIGKGRIIIVSTPTPVLNGTLEDSDNLDFVLSLIAPREKLDKTPVIFDEWSHGLGHDSTVVGFIRQVGLVPALLQLLFVVVLYVWATSGFSPPDKGSFKRRRSSSEQIETLGHLYRQAMRHDITFEKVHTEVRRRIAGVLRCTPAAIESTLGHATPDTAERARNILARLDAIGRGRSPSCPACGYDLTGNTSGKCPECGAAISWQLKEKIVHAGEFAGVPERQKQNKKADAHLAAVLKESHSFVEESARERNRRR